jgi:hypothetical protein
MNIVEILIWESTNALLLIPVVIGIVMLTRWMEGGQLLPSVIGSFGSAIHRNFGRFTCG